MEMIKRNNRFLPGVFNAFEHDFFPVRETAENFSRVAVNVVDNEKNYLIEVAVPGLNKKNIAINITDNQLAIEGTRKVEKEEKEANYTHREFSYGSFKRTFTLPENVDVNKIEANYEEGVLKVIVPKPEDKKATIKQIEIKGK